LGGGFSTLQAEKSTKQLSLSQSNSNSMRFARELVRNLGSYAEKPEYTDNQHWWLISENLQAVGKAPIDKQDLEEPSA
jgi:hypothetical protein